LPLLVGRTLIKAEMSRFGPFASLHASGRCTIFVRRYIAPIIRPMPNDFDKIFKENFEVLLPHLLRKVLGLELPRLEDLKDKIQVTVEREMDNLKKAVHDDPLLDYGLHWEIQSADEDMRQRNLLYYALFVEKYNLPLKQIVIYVGNDQPKRVQRNVLELEGLRLEFQVLNLREIPKDVFLSSNVPEDVVLAILADFGSEQPEKVIRQILQHLLKLIGRVPRLEKYQRQLQTLSRLRKLEAKTKKEISAMPIHYDIETDALYLEGREKGVEIGVEKNKYENVVFLLREGQLSKEKIAYYARVDLAFVLQVEQDLLKDGNN